MPTFTALTLVSDADRAQAARALRTARAAGFADAFARR